MEWAWFHVASDGYFDLRHCGFALPKQASEAQRFYCRVQLVPLGFDDLAKLFLICGFVAPYDREGIDGLPGHLALRHCQPIRNEPMAGRGIEGFDSDAAAASPLILREALRKYLIAGQVCDDLPGDFPVVCFIEAVGVNLRPSGGRLVAKRISAEV